MHTFEGKSTLPDACLAVQQASADWDDAHGLQMLWVFYAPCYEAKAVADAVEARFPGVQMMGCSTAGEWVNCQAQENGLALMGMSGVEVKWSVVGCDVQQGFSAADSCLAVKSLLHGLYGESGHLDPSHQFVLCLMDGKAYMEEQIVSHMHDALEGGTMVGGSAADGDCFEHTTVIANGQVLDSGIVFAMADTKLPFQSLAHQQFQTGDREVVVTDVDASGRSVATLDGLPARQRYAELLGVDKLDRDQYMRHPLVHRFGDDVIVHSVGGERDGGIWLFNAVEEGMVLSIGESQPMAAAMQSMAKSLPNVDVAWVFNCVWRNGLWQTEHACMSDQLAPLQEHVKHMIGFQTYGEQYQGLHHNQTLTMLLLGASIE